MRYIRRYWMYIFTTEGRAGRVEYLIWMIITLNLSICILDISDYLLPILAGGEEVWPESPVYDWALLTGYILLTALHGFMLARRMHDIGWSRWYLFLPLPVPLLILLFALVPGQRRENRFGPPPAPL
jgi:uncharacterized membrane protein YhaH (DUF805 family)